LLREGNEHEFRSNWRAPGGMTPNR
jgi:hypothetical protein